jgi:hypothetical protein
MGKFSFLKRFGKVAAQVGIQAAVASNPGIALAVQVAQASIKDGQTDIAAQVETLNAILVPHGYVVVHTTPAHSP